MNMLMIAGYVEGQYIPPQDHMAEGHSAGTVGQQGASAQQKCHDAAADLQAALDELDSPSRHQRGQKKQQADAGGRRGPEIFDSFDQEHERRRTYTQSHPHLSFQWTASRQQRWRRGGEAGEV